MLVFYLLFIKLVDPISQILYQIFVTKTFVTHTSANSHPFLLLELILALPQCFPFEGCYMNTSSTIYFMTHQYIYGSHYWTSYFKVFILLFSPNPMAIKKCTTDLSVQKTFPFPFSTKMMNLDLPLYIRVSGVTNHRPKEFMQEMDFFL